MRSLQNAKTVKIVTSIDGTWTFRGAEGEEEIKALCVPAL